MTVPVSDETKKRMNKFSLVDWPSVAAEAFEEKIRELSLLKEIVSKSKLSEKDALVLGRKVREGIAARHS